MNQIIDTIKEKLIEIEKRENIFARKIWMFMLSEVMRNFSQRIL